MDADLEQLVDKLLSHDSRALEVVKAVIRCEVKPELVGDRVRGLGRSIANQAELNKIARYCDAMAGY